MKTSKYKKKDLIKYLKEGLSYSEIAKIYNTTKGAIVTKVGRLNLTYLYRAVRPNFINLTGKKFNQLLVLKRAKNNKFGTTYWFCLCDCGTKTTVRGTDLRDNRIKSCGCFQKTDIQGKKSGKLTAIKPTKKRYDGQIVWFCKCECGGSKEVAVTHFRKELVKSCGCIRAIINKNDGKTYNIPDDLYGKKFGTLKIINLEEIKEDKQGRKRFIVNCFCSHCKEIVSKDAYPIATGKTLNCRKSIKLTDTAIINIIKKIIIDNKGKAPSSNILDKIKNAPSTTAIGYKYGGWKNLLALAGYDGDLATIFKFDENYFNTINNGDKAYFLGLIATDGNIHSTRNTLTIGLQDRDAHILKHLLKNVKTNKPLRYVDIKKKYPNSQNIAVLELTSKKLKNDLSKLGIKPQKTFNIKFPNNKIVPEKYMSHYIRGVFDGDGSISKQGRLDFTSGAGKYLISMKKYLDKKLNIKGIMRSSKQSNTKILTFNYGKNKFVTKTFYKYFYNDVKNCFLIRKKERFDCVLNKSGNNSPKG